jgi:hypothetical protein
MVFYRRRENRSLEGDAPPAGPGGAGRGSGISRRIGLITGERSRSSPVRSSRALSAGEGWVGFHLVGQVREQPPCEILRAGEGGAAATRSGDTEVESHLRGRARRGARPDRSAREASDTASRRATRRRSSPRGWCSRPRARWRHSCRLAGRRGWILSRPALRVQDGAREETPRADG